MDAAMEERGHGSLTQFLCFALIGAATALIFAVGYVVLRETGVPAATATTLSYLAAITFQYIGHSGFTFHRKPRDRRQFFRFLALNGAGLVMAMAITLSLTEYLGAPDWAASVAVILVLPMMNWIFMRLWVFA